MNKPFYVKEKVWKKILDFNIKSSFQLSIIKFIQILIGLFSFLLIKANRQIAKIRERKMVEKWIKFLKSFYISIKRIIFVVQILFSSLRKLVENLDYIAYKTQIQRNCRKTWNNLSSLTFIFLLNIFNLFISNSNSHPLLLSISLFFI